MAKEDQGQTLQATALVHEAYIRLVDVEKAQHWDSRGHFFSAAAEAMRRIPIDRAREKISVKHAGGLILQEPESSVDRVILLTNLHRTDQLLHSTQLVLSHQCRPFSPG